MTTLAQLYLEHGQVFCEEERQKSFAAKAHEAMLWALRDAPAPERAEKFIFDVSPGRTISELIKQKHIDSKTLYSMARMPVCPMWIEFPCKVDNETWRIGVLLNLAQISDGKNIINNDSIAATFVMETTSRYVLFGVIALPTFPFPNDGTVNYYIGVWPPEHKEKSIMTGYIQDVVNALFLLSVPRVCELRDHKPSGKLQKRRAKAGKTPLIEYKHVQLKIGIGAPRYAKNANSRADLTSGSREASRLHQVMGHFRTYREGREAPLLTFVPQFWRGDATKGIILHERKVVKKEEKVND